MVSYSKSRDREIRTLTLEAMQVALRTGHINEAKELGEAARRLKERIETHDYTAEDAVVDKINAFIKSRTKITS